MRFLVTVNVGCEVKKMDMSFVNQQKYKRRREEIGKYSTAVDECVNVQLVNDLGDENKPTPWMTETDFLL